MSMSLSDNLPESEKNPPLSAHERSEAVASELANSTTPRIPEAPRHLDKDLFEADLRKRARKILSNTSIPRHKDGA